MSTRLPARPRSAKLKRLVLGRPLASEEAGHQLLPKLLALPVFASDALSSNAYATEEILHVLHETGRSSLRYSLPIASAVVVLLIVVITSYRQTVKAYPRGGGSYVVTKENIGETPGLVAAGALLIDYVLTVSVSIAAGSFALASLIPSLLNHRVAVALAALTVVTLMNLRGAKESGTLFAIPTYGFVLGIMGMLAVGIARCTFGECPHVVSTHAAFEATKGVGLFLILRAFSSGATALTGVEAIADGVPAFKGKRPSEQARAAASTLSMLAALSITMFAGITFLAWRMSASPSPERSVVAQIAHATFGGGAGFVVIQVATTLILILAANTAFQDFPRLSSILAKDRFMPRQFINRGDRLVFSNGVIALSLAAGLLIVLYDAEVTRLIQLYVVGVFTSFTLSQAGMVVRWRRLRSPGWARRATVNGIGSVTTGVVLVVVAVTKFTRGAWIVIVAIPFLVAAFKAIAGHYRSVGAQLRVAQPSPPRLRTQAVVLVSRCDDATMRAVAYAKSLRPDGLRAVHVGGDPEALQRAWLARGTPIPLETLPGDADEPVGPVREAVRALAAEHPDSFVTVVIPETLKRSGWRQFLRRRRALGLKAALLFEPRVVVTDVPVVEGTLPAGKAATPPVRNIALVFVSAVHNASLRALGYARSLNPTDLRAVTFSVDPEETQRVIDDWGTKGTDVPLEVVASPYREVTGPLLRYAGELLERYPDAVVTVVLPEFVLASWWHQFLHNQTALSIKAALLFEPRIVVTSVPYHLR